MLHSITWGQFGLVIFIGLVLYYGYVVVRYYGRELSGFAQGNKNRQDRKGAKLEPAEEAKGAVTGGTSVGDQAAGQGSMFSERAAVEGQTPELFKVMEKVIVLLRQVVSEAAATGVRREELEDRIRMLLSGYRQLVKTPYQVSVNNFISRACATNFSLRLTDAEIG